MNNGTRISISIPPKWLTAWFGRHRAKLSRWSLILLIGFLGVLAVYRLCLRLKIGNELEAIRKAGQPVTLAELDRWYEEVPDAENAATVYEKAFSTLKVEAGAKELLDFAATNVLARPASMTPEQRQAIVDLLATNRESLELLHQAAGLSKSRYHVDFKLGYSVRLPHLETIRISSKLLLLQTVVSLEEGESQKGFQALHDAIRLSESLSREPMQISGLNGISTLNRALDGMETHLWLEPFSDEQLASLTKDVRAVQNPTMLARVMAGERCMGFDVFNLPATELFNPNAELSFRVRMAGQKLLGIWDREKLLYLDFLRESIQASTLPFPQQIAEVKRLDYQVGEKHDSDPEYMKLFSDHSIAMILLPSLTSGFTRYAEANARILATQVALAIARYRLANNSKLPDTLGELVPKYLPAVPTDPFDGKPFRYKKLASGYVIYSVGADCQDDGGAIRSGRGKPYDVTFTVGQ